MKKIEIKKISKEEFKAARKKAWSIVSKKNMFPLAIGVIIGSAFSLVVNALANDVINQIIAKSFGYRSLSYLSYGTTRWERMFIYVDDAKKAIEARGLPLNGIMYGKFLSALVSFLITTAFLFCFAFVSYFIAMRFIRKKEATPQPKSTNTILLEEVKAIRKHMRAPDSKGTDRLILAELKKIEKSISKLS